MLDPYGLEKVIQGDGRRGQSHIELGLAARVAPAGQYIMVAARIVELQVESRLSPPLVARFEIFRASPEILWPLIRTVPCLMVSWRMNTPAGEDFEDDRRRCSASKFQVPALLLRRSAVIPSTTILSKVLLLDSSCNHTGTMVIESMDSSFVGGNPSGLALDTPCKCRVPSEMAADCMTTG